MPAHTREEQFESDIVGWLTSEGGYGLGVDSNYDPATGLDTAELFAFIGATQADRWEQLVPRHGGDRDTAQRKFVARLVSELARRGTVDVLRRGVEDQGLLFRLMYDRPASGLNPTLLELYGRNRLTVTRQLHYSGKNNNSLDLCLFVSGIPVATAELKNKLTGQSVDEAIAQYKEDRDPRDVLLGERALVHFAVDHRLAYMTTRLAGGATQFLPFNQGSAPGQLSCGQGNPANPDGYATAYLWEQVWSYDAWIDILSRFVESFDGGKGQPRRVVFPRFHQWDAVTRLAGDALAAGPGRSYLIQHSAGSGKSNSISWLAHRLSLLHDAADAKVFDKVIVVTDRRVLDEQLRANVQQFESVAGTVVSVEGKGGSKSAELAEALTGKAQIVTVTLETFPYVIAKVAEAELASKAYAVIVDEAHSSQTGDAATALKQALGAGAADTGDGDDGEGEFDAEAALAAVVAARGRQPNLSFFAFTATPKDRTVELFGTPGPDGLKAPFHLYTMRQAIEEGFILDVLANYTTYGTYYRLAAATPEAAAEEVDVRQASSAIRRYVAKDPALIAQKAAIIVEHFRTHTAKELGGRAKAMVVTDSRPAAVKYKQAIDAHIAAHHITDVAALVAFSGTVTDDVAGEVTETSMNGFPESQTAKRFKGTDGFSPGDYQVLIVAEKFQTGFDEPYLHTMFVDKPLRGLNAVQTLSRLNRTIPGVKDSTFVLDFRNTADDIAAAFQRYYEAVIVEPTDANVLYDLRSRIMAVGIIDGAEVTAASDAFFGLDPDKRSLKVIYANVDPAVDRFGDLDDDEQAEFRDALDRFIRAYAFLSQVMAFTDAELERLYVYGKALAACLPAQTAGGLEIGSDVLLTHLRLVAHGAEDIELTPGEIEPGKPFPGEGGAAGSRDPLLDRLEAVIAQINETFGAELDDRDRLEAEKLRLTLLDDDELRTFARANSEENYALEFHDRFKTAILDQEERNRRLYELLLTKPELAALIETELMRETYRELREEDE